MSLFSRKGEDLTSSFQSHVAEMGQKGSVFFPFQGRLLEVGKENKMCFALQELSWECNLF